jgi:predicted alpha/beta superfamily hydrolase
MSQIHLLPEESVPSRHLGTNRTVRIALPASYEREPARRYPVLYLHDGQNVFSSAGSGCCFGWGAWNVDEAAFRLAAEGRMREVILVAIDNTRARYEEYRGPAHAYSARELAELKRKVPAPGHDGAFQNYARFLIEELKPAIDRRFRTLTNAANTGVLGSSMGGICSVALAWEWPQVFGLAGSLSGAFQVERTNFLTQVLRRYDGAPKPIRIYLDSGIVDFTGDDDGRRNTTAVAAELRRIGWRDGTGLIHFVDSKILDDAELEKAGLVRAKWKEARISQHNEFYWRLRVGRALEFLFPPDRS